MLGSRKHTETVHGEVVPPTEDAQAIQATRLSNAEQLAVERHNEINRVWEFTQAYMAILVITSVLVSAIYIVMTSSDGNLRTSALLFLSALANLIAGFYFGRTNHTRPTGENR